MGNHMYLAKLPTDNFKGQLTFPRDFFLRTYNGKLFLFQKPNFDQGIKKLLSDKAFIYNEELTRKLTIPELNDKISEFIDSLDEENQDALVRIQITFDRPTVVQQKANQTFGLRVKVDGKGKTFTEIGCVVTASDEQQNFVYVDRNNSGGEGDFDPDFGNLRNIPVEYFNVSQRKVNMDILIDRNSIETFMFDGMYSMSNLVFSAESGIQVFTRDPYVTVDRLSISVLNKTVPFRQEIPQEENYFLGKADHSLFLDKLRKVADELGFDKIKLNHLPGFKQILEEDEDN